MSVRRTIVGRVHETLILQVRHLGLIQVERIDRHLMTVSVTGLRFPRILNIGARFTVSFDLRAFHGEFVGTS